MSKKILVALSGGVDSSVAAAILKKAGYEVLGLFMHNGISSENKNRRSCCSLQDANDAREVAYQLGIKFYSLDFSKEFSNLIDYFVSEYLNGRTPNPCIKCNTYLKFGALSQFANLVDADFIATGHYAQITKNNNRFQIELSQKQLEKSLFPLGALTKQQVRKIASEFSLKTAKKDESQDLCFIPDGNLKKFLETKIVNTDIKGSFIDTQGKKLGEHRGYVYYTIGQRKGLGIARGIPLYVKEINPYTKNIVLGKKEDILCKKVLVQNVRWVSIEKPQAETILKSQVKIRYKHPKSLALVKILEQNLVEIEFEEKQSAVTPGQAACFYDNDILLGGGWIEKGYN